MHGWSLHLSPVMYNTRSMFCNTVGERGLGAGFYTAIWDHLEEQARIWGCKDDWGFVKVPSRTQAEARNHWWVQCIVFRYDKIQLMNHCKIIPLEKSMHKLKSTQWPRVLSVKEVKKTCTATKSLLRLTVQPWMWNLRWWYGKHPRYVYNIPLNCEQTCAYQPVNKKCVPKDKQMNKSVN